MEIISIIYARLRVFKRRLRLFFFDVFPIPCKFEDVILHLYRTYISEIQFKCPEIKPNKQASKVLKFFACSTTCIITIRYVYSSKVTLKI